MPGPLTGLRVVELGGIGPGPHGAMLLADLGADVVRVERPSGGLKIGPEGSIEWGRRGVRSVAANVKTEDGLALVKALIAKADVVIDGFRPGVTERLGYGPDDFADSNPGLIYARMTGWGQDGPLASSVGHDINYIGLTGALHAMGTPDAPPAPPLNLVGDFGGGSLYLVLGILAALFERQSSGRGQVVDAAIVDGVASLSQPIWSLLANGAWRNRRQDNILDGAAHFYRTYTCSDGKFVAVGAIEPQFYADLVTGLELTGIPPQLDKSTWPEMSEKLAAIFATRTRDDWAAHFAGTDACVTPVLDFDEAAQNEHLRARGSVIELAGTPQAGPAPHFSRSAPGLPSTPGPAGEGNDSVVADWGITL
ncbi:CaiB/BaiF CoA transferase family protein [Cumulibacter manganitolerans]|uniref:CaiB/BaiF CoA transferase family protein n=1 Tax=Cumulibacter manganitolerans TaxID=1884992 RepID=UPI0012955C2E|nr:CaiB/BaiF CoA-transferase family protein [Cumulibacter manganitolerans]